MNFDLVLPSTVTRNYKPNPKVYQAAINSFELEEQQTLAFVAAHAWDLAAAGEQWVYVHMRRIVLLRTAHHGIGSFPQRLQDDLHSTPLHRCERCSSRTAQQI